MEVRVNFIFENKIPLQVLCSSNDEMVNVFGKFKSKLNPDANIDDYEFSYLGEVLGYESTLAKNIKFPDSKSSTNEITILVKRRVRICKCPECKCNDCIINLNNYQVFFSGCKYGHSVKVVYDNYNNMQRIDLNSIRCHTGGCKKTLSEEQFDFYKCLTCSKRDGISKYFCTECTSKHKKSDLKVKYDEKNYYCDFHLDHLEKFEKCCLTCAKDLCKSCEEEHPNHKIVCHSDMTTSVENLKESLNKIKDNIDTLNSVIENIKYHLEGTIRIYERYYNIANDIIKKFETFNRNFKNYRILRTIRNLKFSNKQMLEDLNKMINEKDLKYKCSVIIETYITKEKMYKGIESNLNNAIENESDDKWYEEIQKIKQSKKKKEEEKEPERRRIKNFPKKK